MPVYVDSNRNEWLESIAYTSDTLNLSEADQANLFRYQLGIEETSTKTTGEFVVSGETFYIEYERKLYQWTYGDRKWRDTGMQDEPVFADFYATDGFQFAVSGEIVYLGKSSGTLFQSLNGGDTWRDVTPNFPFPLDRAEPQSQLLKKLPHFREIIFVGGTVYVSTNDGVAMSNDGENWRMLTDSMSAPIPMHQLAINGTTLYGVSQTGAYRLNQDTGVWTQITSEIPGPSNFSRCCQKHPLYWHRAPWNLTSTPAQFVGYRNLQPRLYLINLIISRRIAFYATPLQLMRVTI